MADDVSPFPALEDLHERHYGLTQAIARNYAERNYAEGASICMQRHHVSPRTLNISDDTVGARDYLAVWDTPSDRQVAAWNNRDDATRDGAYGIVIASAEAHLGLFVTGRAAPGSGSDYLLCDQPYNQDVDDLLDFEEVNLVRLEVSGIDRCDGHTHLESRVRIKIAQLETGKSALPGIAGVVAFNLARVQFRRL